MSNFDDDVIDPGARAIFSWGIIVILLIIGTMTLVYKCTPWWNDMETKGTERSYTFVQTKKEFLVKLAADYDALNVSIEQHRSEPSFVDAAERQKKSILTRMRLEAESLPEGEIPRSVQPLLAK
jgi:hypothetical protein